MKSSSSTQSLCPLCESGNFWPVSFIDPTTDSVVQRKSGYHWRLCQTCGNATPSCLADPMTLKLYWEKNRVDQGTFKVTKEVWERRIEASRAWAERTYNFCSPWIRTEEKHFFDIGCGLGETVATFASQGWTALGLDPDPNTKLFHQRLGIDSLIGRIEETQVPFKFDLIGISHAIYFIQDPRGFVRRIRSMLSPGGLFVIVSTHLFSSLSMGRPSFVHTWYPTKDSLIYVLNLEGFELVDSRTVKGSDMLLFRPSAPQPLKSCSLGAYWLHRTHSLRYYTIGALLRLARFIYRSATFFF